MTTGLMYLSWLAVLLVKLTILWVLSLEWVLIAFLEVGVVNVGFIVFFKFLLHYALRYLKVHLLGLRVYLFEIVSILQILGSRCFYHVVLLEWLIFFLLEISHFYENILARRVFSFHWLGRSHHQIFISLRAVTLQTALLLRNRGFS